MQHLLLSFCMDSIEWAWTSGGCTSLREHDDEPGQFVLWVHCFSFTFFFLSDAEHALQTVKNGRNESNALNSASKMPLI